MAQNAAPKTSKSFRACQAGYARFGVRYQLIHAPWARNPAAREQLDSSRFHRFLKNQTLSIKAHNDTRAQSHPPTVTEIPLTWFFGECGQLASSTSTTNPVALNRDS